MSSQYIPNNRKYITNIPRNDNDYDTNYIKNQSDIIKNNNRNVPVNYTPPYNDMYTAIPGIFGKKFPPKDNDKKEDRYDPLTDFLNKNGLLDRDNALTYKTEYINIDSSVRNKYPIPQTDELKWKILTNSPLKFEFNSDVLEIIDYDMASGIQVDDKIMLTGVQPIITITFLCCFIRII